MMKAEEKSERRVVMYMFRDSFVLWGWIKGSLYPLSCRTGRRETDSDGDAASKNIYLLFIQLLDALF